MILRGPYGLVTADISNLANQPTPQRILQQKAKANVILAVACLLALAKTANSLPTCSADSREPLPRSGTLSPDSRETRINAARYRVFLRTRSRATGLPARVPRIASTRIRPRRCRRGDRPIFDRSPRLAFPAKVRFRRQCRCLQVCTRLPRRQRENRENEAKTKARRRNKSYGDI